MLQFPLLKFWSEEELYKLQVQAVSRFMRVDTPHAVEASIELASDILEIVNFAVKDDDVAAGGRNHRLVTRWGKVYDRESTVA